MEQLLENQYILKMMETGILAVVISLLAWLTTVIASKKEKRPSEAPIVIKYMALIFFTIGLVFIWLEGIGPVLTAFTIVAAALTIVSKEMILNFLGSFVIFWRELFAIGDRVQVGEHLGDVIDKGLLYFTLLEAGRPTSTGHSTGRLIKIPNSLVMTLPVINATRGAGYVWNELRIAITRTSDWERAKAILTELGEAFIAAQSMNLEHVRKSFERRKIYFRKLTPKVYIAIHAGAISLTLRYVCSSRLVRESEDFIYSGFLEKLPDEAIELSETLES